MLYLTQLVYVNDGPFRPSRTSRYCWFPSTAASSCSASGRTDPRPDAGRGRQRDGVHDLVGCPPDLGEVLDDARLVGDVQALPGDQHLVHPAAQKDPLILSIARTCAR
jgi:hypothetical protein